MKQKKKSLLWAFSKKVPSSAASKTSYLFGTMHVRDQRAFGLLEEVYEKIDACDVFATEFNLEEMHQQATADTMNLPDDLTLSSLFSPKKYKKVAKVFEKATNLQLQFFENSRPFLITSLISEAILSKDMPFSLDESLWRYAKEQEKELSGLETYQQQIDIIKSIPLDQQVKALSDIGRNFKKFRKQLLKMTDAYAAGDIHRLYKDARKNAQGLRKILLYNRNQNMVNKIIEITEEKTLCCAVGAGHLAGKKGILKLLKDAGFKIHPVLVNKENQ